MNYEGISKWIIPKKIVDDTLSIMRERGKDGYEVFTFWIGNKSEHIFEVKELLIPNQNAYKSVQGAWVDIPGKELEKMNQYLYTKKLQMPIQVHSHPGRAYHSSRDDKKSILIFPGSFSMVVPNFGVDDFKSFEQWAVYKKHNENGWVKLQAEQMKNLFDIRG